MIELEPEVIHLINNHLFFRVVLIDDDSFIRVALITASGIPFFNQLDTDCRARMLEHVYTSSTLYPQPSTLRLYPL